MSSLTGVFVNSTLVWDGATYHPSRGWDRCPGCGDKLATTERIGTVGVIRTQRCLDPKTTGCLFSEEGET